mgnify:CR=1 FL=1
MASTESGRQMYPSFKEAHEAFVAEYSALYQGFPKYLEDLVIGFWAGGKTPRGKGGSLFRPIRKVCNT